MSGSVPDLDDTSMSFEQSVGGDRSGLLLGYYDISSKTFINARNNSEIMKGAPERERGALLPKMAKRAVVGIDFEDIAANQSEHDKACSAIYKDTF